MIQGVYKKYVCYFFCIFYVNFISLLSIKFAQLLLDNGVLSKDGGKPEWVENIADYFKEYA